MFDMVLNLLLDFLSCFAVVLREILETAWYMPNWSYCIHSKLRIFPLLRSHRWKYNIQANKRLTNVKEKWWLFHLMFFIFLSFPSLQCPIKCYKQKWGVLFFTLIKLVARVRMQSQASNEKDWTIRWKLNTIDWLIIK